MERQSYFSHSVVVSKAPYSYILKSSKRKWVGTEDLQEDI